MKLEKKFTFDNLLWNRTPIMVMYYEWIKLGGMPTQEIKISIEDDQ